jgi:hypothetical protein
MRAAATAGYRSRVSPTRTLPAVALVLLALSGCTLMPPGSGRTSTGEPSVTVIDQAAVLEELGPVPPAPELTEAVLDDYLARSLDWQWANVVRNYPHAERHEVAEIERASGSNPRAMQCADEARAAGLDPQAFAVAVYTCAAQFPSLPTGTLSRDQARYLYDYWTRFVVPCYADAGYPDTSTPPTREFFAANWPFQNWAPQPKLDNHAVGGPEFDTVLANCPGFPDGMQT